MNKYEIDNVTYKRAFFAAPYYITINDWKSGEFIDVNPSFEIFTGLKRDDVLGKTLDDLFFWPSQNERKVFVDVLKKYRTVKNMEIKLLNANKEIRDIRISANLNEENGRNILVSIVSDHTEEKKYFDELQLHKNSLEQMVLERTIKLNNALEELQISSRMDSLTKVYNRAFFNESFELMCQSAIQTQKPLAIILLDIDLFKNINDQFGHLCGDKCLKDVAQIIKNSHKRKEDVVFRYGGEEFVILLQNTDSLGAKIVAEKIRKEIKKAKISYNDVKLNVTSSIGIFAGIPQKENHQNILEKADYALYQSKNTGRNKTTVYKN